MDIVRRGADAWACVVLPQRGIMERTAGWLYRYRRLSEDCACLTETSECMIYLAMIHLMLKRLRPCEET